jgi:hypothetical protein
MSFRSARRKRLQKYRGAVLWIAGYVPQNAAEPGFSIAENEACIKKSESESANELPSFRESIVISDTWIV